ncbi:hypothetical protein DUI87_23825 [Hirundo rustica rustica]|uniref:ribonuclease H n=1 Tax=Hirundo rustica rustica TaxID=333673 RepID=A0A3M0JF36_HIRRU|nr:hypothetical protein DUI87_23825 [Hirundo rustica rustica]
MDSTKFKLWEAVWRQLLREALPGLLVDPETAVDEEGNALTLEHLMGEGRWVDPTDQASHIPIKALHVVRECAVSAFFGMMPDGPVVPYYKILQGTKESFTKFVERLTRAIEVQVANVAVREGILREMVFANANALCKNAILSLLLDPPPTIQDMLRVCQVKVPFMQGNDPDQKPRPPRVNTVDNNRASSLRDQNRRPYVPQKNRCIICGEPGHWANNCPLRDAIEALKNKKGEAGEMGEWEWWVITPPVKLEEERRSAWREDRNRADRAVGGGKEDRSADETLANKTSNTGHDTSPDMTQITDHDLSKPILKTISKQEPFKLELTEAVHFTNTEWIFLSINIQEQDTWPVEGKEFIVIGDCKYTPQEIEVLPGVLVNDPGNLVLWLRFSHPPTFLPRGQILAQIIPTRGPSYNSTIQVACPVQAITEERPRVACEFTVGGETLNITGLLDTGADVTVVPSKDWPSHWALQDVAGHVQGVGGLQLAKQSRSVVQIKGPKGQLANICPFVLDYKEPLIGRDLMAQWGVKIDIPDPSVDISTVTIEECPTKKLNWLTNDPVWVEQWPLSKQKLKALEELVEEQLRKGHIVETNSPRNSLVFVIQKPGKDKWRLLQDLRQINNIIEDMGSLQPGMPSPTMLPQNWQLAIIDIKDCFFQIPLHPDDAPRFAFSVPTIN